MKYEHRSERLIPKHRFMLRLLRSAGIASGIIMSALGIGVLGYHYLEGLSWVDAILNAAMLLGGMGQVSELHATGAKLFASAYAIFCGVVFLTVAAVLFAPVAHRLLHRFHLEAEPEPEARKAHSNKGRTHERP
jgi:hypothetical protein